MSTRPNYGDGSADDFQWGEIKDYKKKLEAIGQKYEIAKNLKDSELMSEAISEANEAAKDLDYYKSRADYMNRPKLGEETASEQFSQALRMQPEGSLDYMAGAYMRQNPVTSFANYGSSISGGMMPGAKRTAEQNKTGTNPLYSDPEFIKYIAQYGFDKYGRKMSNMKPNEILQAQENTQRPYARDQNTNRAYENPYYIPR